MIEFSQQTVSGDAWETGLALFILFIFAIIASGYVLKEGLRKKEKTTHEILIKCVIIITSVVPRQFPMQMAMAVNMALMSLMKVDSLPSYLVEVISVDYDKIYVYFIFANPLLSSLLSPSLSHFHPSSPLTASYCSFSRRLVFSALSPSEFLLPAKCPTACSIKQEPLLPIN
jgi:hypothetical protein